MQSDSTRPFTILKHRVEYKPITKKMTELSRHIEILLLENDCVIVPGFGGFMAHYRPADYVEEEGLFLPPQRTLGFNPQLQLNDSLLAQAYVEAYDISYPEAVRRIESEVEEVKQQIAIEGIYEFHGIGTITMKANDKYEFTPCMAGLLTPTLYALNSFDIDCLTKSPALVTIPVTKIEEEEDHEETETLAEQESSSIYMLRNLLAAAMILLLFIFSSIPAGEGSSNVNTCSVVDTELLSSFVIQQDAALKAEMTAEAMPAEAEAASATEETTAASTTEETISTEASDSVAAAPKAKDTKTFVIVLASKVSKSGAEDFVIRLKNAGYNDAKIYERGTMRKVVYGQYANEAAAMSSLRSLREKEAEFAEAWISEI